ncbi:hypothetical protein MKX01_015269 [Papaver californicum]|nr:hypothetical protein MKX01_015269 [Papaver californicum]
MTNKFLEMKLVRISILVVIGRSTCDGGYNKMVWEDEFSMSSMLKNDMNVPQRSVGGEDDCNSAWLNKMFDDMVADFQSKCTGQFDLGSSKYMKHDYPLNQCTGTNWMKLLILWYPIQDQTKATVDTKAQEEDVD